MATPAQELIGIASVDAERIGESALDDDSVVPHPATLGQLWLVDVGRGAVESFGQHRVSVAVGWKQREGDGERPAGALPPGSVGEARDIIQAG